MAARKTLVRIALALSALTAAAVLPSQALAVGDVASGAHGYDISWPQCNQANPALNQQFGVVGINGGRPFHFNPCLGAEYGWALSGSAAPQVYINLEYGERTRGYSSCEDTDAACKAYNFGYNAAENAYVRAYDLTLGGSGMASIWWIDVETMNDWSDNTDLNRQVIRGALDYLRRAGRKVGVYSTPSQWHLLAGDYRPQNVGNWVVSNDIGDTSQCGKPLWSGAPIWMYQWLNEGADIDENHAC